MQKKHAEMHTNRAVAACLWTVDRWWCDGPGPESSAVLYHYNLLCSVLPTAAKDNMFHPPRADSEAVPLLLCTCSLRATATTNGMVSLFLDYFVLGIFGNFMLLYLLFVSKWQKKNNNTTPDGCRRENCCIEFSQSNTRLLNWTHQYSLKHLRR